MPQSIRYSAVTIQRKRVSWVTTSSYQSVSRAPVSVFTAVVPQTVSPSSIGVKRGTVPLQPPLT